MEMVKRMVGEKAVVIFSKKSCCMSHSIKSLISSYGANPTIYELDEEPKGHQIETALIQIGPQPSVPAVFIGGAKEVLSLQIRNELVPLLLSAKAIWVWNS